MALKIGVPREVADGECRVALTPDLVAPLEKLGFEVLVETGAGARAQFLDGPYEKAGAAIVDRAAALACDIVLKIHGPTDDELGLMREGTTVIALLWPRQHEDLPRRYAEAGITGLALDAIPRISRAQSMDVLSSMAAIAGYRAVVEASYEFGRYMSQQFTAAGSTDPANVLVIGAGVAGLASVATAREMGARVRAFDTRDAVREEVESLGAEFLPMEFEESGEGEGGYAKVMSEAFMDAERALFEAEAPTTDVIISTANIPGRQAPMLITKDAVEAMQPGSVIIDLASQTGGNCELTEPGKVVEHNGVRIVGYTDLTSRLPAHASQFFGRNILNLLKLMTDEEFQVDVEDEVVRGMLVAHQGEVMWPPPPVEVKAPPKRVEVAAVEPAVTTPHGKAEKGTSRGASIATAVAAVLLGLIGLYAPTDFIQHVTVFVLACFVGWQVIWNVSPSLHTPLMSVTNAISGIIIVGGIVQATVGASQTVLILAVVSIAVASINIFGGFLVTQRMLKMFRLD